MQHFDFTLPVNGAREIHVQGSYVYYLAGSAGGADDTIVLKNVEGSDEVILRPGQSFDIGAGEKFVRWNISNYKNQGTIVGRLMMGAGVFSDNRISGSVEVIDGAKSRTMAEIAFGANVANGAAAGLYSQVQLWNPAASKKHIVIEKLIVSCVFTGFTGGSFAIRKHNAELANLRGIPGSKFLKAAATVTQAETRFQNNAAAIGTEFMGVTCQNYAPVYFKFAAPIVIPPGLGLIVGPSNVDAAVYANFEYYEEAI